MKSLTPLRRVRTVVDFTPPFLFVEGVLSTLESRMTFQLLTGICDTGQSTPLLKAAQRQLFGGHGVRAVQVQSPLGAD